MLTNVLLKDLRFSVTRALGSCRYSSEYNAYDVPGLVPPPSDYKRGAFKPKPVQFLPDNAFPFGQIELPKRVPCIYQSGDLEPEPKIDLSQPILELRGCKLLEGADEVTKKLVSLEFARRSDIKKLLMHDTVAKVQRHKYDTDSPEAKVAKMTVHIRDFIQLSADRTKPYVRIYLKENIEKRTKILKEMAMFDKERFEWLLKELKLVYMPSKGYVINNVTVKGFYQLKCSEYCRKVREHKILAYRDQLRKQQPVFEDEKKRTMAWIEDQIKKFDIKPEEIDTEKKETDWLAKLPAKWKFPEMPTPTVVPPPLE